MNDEEKIPPEMPAGNAAEKNTSGLMVALGVISGLSLPLVTFGVTWIIAYSISGSLGAVMEYLLPAVSLGLVIAAIYAVRRKRWRGFAQGFLIGIGAFALIFGICTALVVSDIGR